MLGNIFQNYACFCMFFYFYTKTGNLHTFNLMVKKINKLFYRKITIK